MLAPRGDDAWLLSHDAPFIMIVVELCAFYHDSCGVLGHLDFGFTS